jgi:LDH2 family malate/lactate/ureidoglycolate dehydrogenase
MAHDGPAGAVRADLGILAGWAKEVLEVAGASPEAAAATAEACVEANRKGFDSHGVVYLPLYLDRLRAGLVDGAAMPEVVAELPALALIDGHFAPGAFVGRRAVDWCCERAETQGMAAAVTRNSSHFGPASYYSEIAAARGCLGIVLSNADPGLAPEGALAAVLGTNPLAIAAPAPGIAPGLDGPDRVGPSLDMATSKVAQGKISQAARRGDTIPGDWALGRDGLPTTDPVEALANCVLPAGGYKGFGLAFMIDVLTACLAGGTISPELQGERGVSQFFVAIKVGALSSRESYDSRLDKLVQAVHGAPRREGTAPFLMPGEREALAAAARTDSIDLDASSLRLLEASGADWGVPFPYGVESADSGTSASPRPEVQRQTSSLPGSM